MGNTMNNILGDDIGCICSRDTGDIPVPKSDYKFDSPDNSNKNLFKNNIITSEEKQYTERSINKISKIQNNFKLHNYQSQFKKNLQKREQIFDTSIINYANILNSQEVNDLEKYTKNTIREIEQQLKPFTPANNEIKQYHFIFQRNAYQFKNNKLIYKGYWNYNGQKHGFGICIDDKGNKYIGFWMNDLFEGRGRYININGDYYEGYWKEGKANGVGVLKMKNGYTYDGLWKNDYQQGKGKEVYSDKCSYEGNFDKGIKEGYGKFLWNDGAYYEGNFSGGGITGKGKFVWADGRSYDGQWINGQMEGKGKFTWPNGRKYIGDYKASKKEGFGKYYWGETNYYEGNWVNNAQHGEGTYVDGMKKYKGIFRFGKLIQNEKNIRKSDMLRQNSLENEYKEDEEDQIDSGIHKSFQME